MAHITNPVLRFFILAVASLYGTAMAETPQDRWPLERPRCETLRDPILVTKPKVLTFPGINGHVIIAAIVDTSGKVEGVRLLRGIRSDATNTAALRAVLGWRYRPATCGGAPVRLESIATVTVRSPRIH